MSTHVDHGESGRGRVGMSDWRFGLPDAGLCLLLLAIGSALWLPGLGRRGLWTSGEARAVQTARRMVRTGDWITMKLDKREPKLMVDPAGGVRGTWRTGWSRWPTRLDYDNPNSVEAIEEGWRDAVFGELSKGPPPAQLRYDYITQIHKPVFFYWLVAAGYKLGVPYTGEWAPFAIRCFSTVPAILLLPVVYLFGCLLYDRLAGFIAATSLASCMEYFWIARVSKMDMTLTFMLGVAFLCWYLGHRGIRPILCNLVVYVMLGCASLMKSIAYFLLPALIVLLYLAVEQLGEVGLRQAVFGYPRVVWQTMRRMHFFAGLIIVLAIVLPWHIRIHKETDGQFTRVIFLQHNLSRAGLTEYGREFEATTGPFFYLGRILVDMLPWWIMLPGAIVHVFRPRCRAFWRQGAWLILWMGVWLIFFSYLLFRKEEYILPLYPAAMLLVGKMLADFIRSPGGGHITWRVFADATKVGLAWLFGRRPPVADPQDAVSGDLRMAIALRIAAIAMTLVTVLAGAFGLLVMSERVRNVIFAFPRPDRPWIGNNEHDRTAFHVAATFMSDHMGGALALLTAIMAGMIVAAVLVFKRRPAPALALWTMAMFAVQLAMVHVFQDRVQDRFRSQRALAQRLEEIVTREGPDTRLILFGAEDHELVYLMPERFDAIPRLRFPLVRGRLEALRDHPVLVLLPRRDYENTTLFGPYAWGDLKTVLREVPTNIPDYDRAHNDALVILLAPKGRSPVGKPT